MKRIACLLVVLAIWGNATIGNSPEPVTAAGSVQTVSNWTPDEKPVMVQSEADKWVAGILSGYGLELSTGVTVEVTDKDNCGSELSAEGTGGGCYIPELGTILISPTIVGTDSGKIVLLHEYAHSIGFMDECAAEVYSHTLFETDLWAYPECNTGK